MKPKSKLTLSALFLLLTSMLLSACASRAATSEIADVAPVAMEMPVEEAGAPARDAGSGAYNLDEPQANPERMVIKNADLSIVVDDPTLVMDRITRLAEEMGGFVVSANLSQMRLENGKEVPSANILIRVPATRFNEALDRIRSESDQLPQHENINSQDITSEYVNLESRLRNLEAAEAQLTEIMGSATKTEDVLSVYNELVSVREQIEVIKGQMQYYADSAAFSLVNVELRADEAMQPLSIGGWQPGGVVKQSIQSLINFFQWLVDFLIRLVILILPVLAVLFIIFVLPVLLIVWAIRRRSRRKAEAKKNPEAPENKPE
jgi:hypothetical protein